MTIDVSVSPGFNCIIAPWKYQDRLLGYTLGLPIFLLLLAMPTLGIQLYGKLKNGDIRSHPRYQAVVSQCWWSIIVTLFVVCIQALNPKLKTPNPNPKP